MLNIIRHLYHIVFHEKIIEGKIFKKGFRGNYLNKMVFFIFIGLKMAYI